MLSCKVGSAGEVFAPAKLNLYLNVLGPRPDGFHDLETLMVPVRVYDTLRWTDATSTATDDRLTVRIRNRLAEDTSRELGHVSDNLVFRAAELLAQSAGITPRGTFELTKRIPIQAGMGGGSSDAAAALVLANKVWGVGYSPEQLGQLAAELGSDVPFFLQSSPAICRGRGERIETAAGLPRLHFVVVKPPAGLSTATVFSRLKLRQSAAETSAQPLEQLVRSLRRGAVAQAGYWMRNTLETAASELSPWIARLRQVLSDCGAWAHLMTGSGSACFGVMRSALQARRTAQILASRNLGTVWATSSC
ncbi:MAG: 4-(cytidine 5'-diphospho)-2-C-methyl-D-erythritol kinase [Pirellulales bacterium]|nr:4-(cytidine 5'-diphospho)-2-C-methyl-D-erythritol kinase [Pirellulales bacterium]